ncbi:hypothetical protein SAY86_021856 [Trapa natans]|uniref:Uncharacterized protein n=1 Tax=Trapa natans TaxID=22666 RepID=A0AAN7M9D9_TRANT|nr:hypothetical protein SAY86_021856 [Trapa natans]
MPEEDPIRAGDGDASNEKITSGPEEDYRTDPDFPPESFLVSKDAELDWYDKNAVYERKESAKGISGTNPTNTPAVSHRLPASSNMKSKKASIIGLPKTQKHGMDPKSLRSSKAGNWHLFPQKTGLARDDPSVKEPSSPKVSCMGKVGPKKDPDRRGNESSQRDVVPEKGRKSGFFTGIGALFRSSCREGRAISAHSPVAVQSSAPGRKNSVAVTSSDVRKRLPPAGDRSDDSAPRRRSAVDSEPTGLAGMVRFSSGRRPNSWGIAATNRDEERV